MISIGVNWTYPRSLAIIKQLAYDGLIDFCELSVDNFVHLTPELILASLDGLPLSLHFLSSRFLEKTHDELSELGNYLHQWIKKLKPIYISDHIAKYSTQKDRRLPFPREINYLENQNNLLEKIQCWQAMLGVNLYLENFPSMENQGKEQANFFHYLLTKNVSGLLFDISNAYIAELNQVLNYDSWESLINKTNHFHVGGYRFFESTALDTHDMPISNEVLNKITLIQRGTLVLEADKTYHYEEWKNEIIRIKTVIHA